MVHLDPVKTIRSPLRCVHRLIDIGIEHHLEALTANLPLKSVSNLCTSLTQAIIMGPKPFLGQLKKAFLVSVLLTTKSVTTSEVFHSGKLSALEIARLGRQVDKSLLELYGCMNQSCLIADTSGSTGRVPFMKAEGATDADIACIVAHNQEIGELLKAYDNNPPLGPKQPLTVISSFLSGVNGLGRPIVAASGSTETGTYDGSCASNILLFAKGTFEFGAYGITIGPELIRSLPSDWTAGGINYDSDIQGEICIDSTLSREILIHGLSLLFKLRLT